MTNYTDAQQEAIGLTARVIDLLYEILDLTYTDAARKHVRHEIRGINLLRAAIKSGEPYSTEVEELLTKYREDL